MVYTTFGAYSTMNKARFFFHNPFYPVTCQLLGFNLKVYAKSSPFFVKNMFKLDV